MQLGATVSYSHLLLQLALNRPQLVSQGVNLVLQRCTPLLSRGQLAAAVLHVTLQGNKGRENQTSLKQKCPKRLGKCLVQYAWSTEPFAH